VLALPLALAACGGSSNHHSSAGKQASQTASTAQAGHQTSQAASTAAPGQRAGGSRPGWGLPTAPYLGRYRLLSTGRVSSGELTVFLRKVKALKVPSGILALHSARESDVLYLTDLARSGSRRIARVRIGSFLGPAVGSLRGTIPRAGALDATLTLPGRTLPVRLLRFSLSPAP
jgi:hypothetical protein